VLSPIFKTPARPGKLRSPGEILLSAHPDGMMGLEIVKPELTRTLSVLSQNQPSDRPIRSDTATRHRSAIDLHAPPPPHDDPARTLVKCQQSSPGSIAAHTAPPGLFQIAWNAAQLGDALFVQVSSTGLFDPHGKSKCVAIDGDNTLPNNNPFR